MVKMQEQSDYIFMERESGCCVSDSDDVIKEKQFLAKEKEIKT